MKKLFLSLLVGLLCAASLWAYDFQSGDLYYKVTDGTARTVEVTYQYKESSRNYSDLTKAVIPETVEYDGRTYSVTSIGSYTFYDCSSLTEVVIPNSVMSIGSEAFSGCSGLTEIVIPESVTSIGGGAFLHCSGLTEVVIGNSVTSIGGRAFEGCSGLTEVVIPNSVTSIGGRAFEGCSGLTEVVIPNSVTSIGYQAFRRCSGLTAITIPASVTSIGTETFSNCSALANIVVAEGNTIYDSREGCNAIIETATNTLIAGCQNSTIPNNVTSIEEYAFYGCSGLTEVVISNSITRIGNYAFAWCSSLTQVVIPNSITRIGNFVFSGCSSLMEVVIPNNVTSIGNGAFKDCSGLTNIVIGDGVTSIEYAAFYGCRGLQSLTWDAITCEDFSSKHIPFKDCSSLTSFVLSDKVTRIPAYLCYGLSKMTEVTIGEGVTAIGDDAFRGCSGVQSITWNAVAYEDFSSQNMPFKDCSSLTSFTLGNKVTRIPAYLCYGLSKMTEIVIPESVTTIGSSAFYGCSGLSELTLPKNVRLIGEDAFSSCSALRTVYAYSIDPPTLSSSSNGSIFSNIQPDATLYVWNNSIEAYKALEYWKTPFALQSFSAEYLEEATFSVVPFEHSVVFTWPIDYDAYTYSLIVRKGNTLICSLEFDLLGNASAIQYAPGRKGAQQSAVEITDGYRYTLTGLEADTRYAYVFQARSAQGSSLYNQAGSFYTLSDTPTDLEDVQGEGTDSNAPRKIIRDGQVLILRDGQVYDLTGARVE